MNENDVQRSLGRIEGLLNGLKENIENVSKGQNDIWKAVNGIKKEMSDIKVNMARIENQKVGWRDLNGAIKTALAALSFGLGAISLILGLKGGI